MLKSLLNSSLFNSTFLGRFLKNEKGTAAIEFIFIAPVMLITYFGLSEVSLLVAADRDVSHAASVTADLSTQSETLDADDIEDIFNAALAVMGVSSTQAGRVTIDIVSYEMDGSGNLNEIGYAKIGSGLASHYDPGENLSTSLLNTTSGLLITRIKYEYESPSGLGYYVTTPTLSETFMLKPRKSPTIPFDGNSINCTLSGSASAPRASCS